MKTITLVRTTLRAITLMVLISTSSLSVGGELETLTAQQAYEKAKLLNAQYKKKQAKNYLKYAISKGHAKATFMYSELIKHNAFVQQKDESDYALKAAQLGSVNAMVKVTRSIHISKQEKDFFRGQALAILKRKIKSGDVQAIGKMPGLYSDDDRQMDWVIKAAEAGHPHSQYYLAKRYQHGTYGWFLIPGNREREIRRLFKAAAESGYPPAIDKYGSVLYQDNTLKAKKEALEWFYKGVENGEAQSLLFFARLHTEVDWLREVLPFDKTKGAGYYQAYFSVMSDEHDKELYDIYWEFYQTLLSTMTEPEKQQANKFAQDYLSTHTVRAFDDFWEWGVDYGVRAEIKDAPGG
ncbi:hypothetical protein L3Q72_05620 [Vibrio sp. JC009]|uniref:tetratricopeptide repeat protein n=1 Tax=Vibrio sp. JC009 TaxID=2912314 RepID=UPI0023AF8E32|nr:hypothetical protein [Vibrio sp. JC009]WED22872.1 hypothetical protein L3Q72_05620 [Vibrio sp. JC009]